MRQATPTVMPRAESPITPLFPFNEPGVSITLHKGPIASPTVGARPGLIELSCQPHHGLRWQIEHRDGDFDLDLNPETLYLRRNGLEWPVESHRRDFGSGWINAVTFCQPNARLNRVVVHWMNLADLRGTDSLWETTQTGERWWLGRWQTNVNGWHLTIDSRPDYGAATTTANSTHLYLITHVMEIHRVDGEEFDVESVDRLLECLRVTFSFAFGRWMAPILPVGYAQNGEVVWEKWTSPICDPLKRITAGWLHEGHPDDLTNLVQCALPAFLDKRRDGFTRFQMLCAVQATATGFVEQRILAAAPAMEHLTWLSLVFSRRWTRREYANRYAEDRLRFVLEEASIPTGIDSDLLPSLANFARSYGLDGPKALTKVRNCLVHPQRPRDQIYRHEGLVQDAWLLSRHYLTLLILRSIGYVGSSRNLLRRTGWVGETTPVPWANTGQSAPQLSPPPTRQSVQRGRTRVRRSISP